jgi:hypothetical protein
MGPADQDYRDGQHRDVLVASEREAQQEGVGACGRAELTSQHIPSLTGTLLSSRIYKNIMVHLPWGQHRIYIVREAVALQNRQELSQ